MVGMLLKSGANPNAQDEIGTTPLMNIGSNGWNESEIVASTLLAAGADPCIRDRDGRDALDQACGLQNDAFTAALALAVNRCRQ